MRTIKRQDKALLKAQKAAQEIRTARDPRSPEQQTKAYEAIQEWFAKLGKLTDREMQILKVGWEAGSLAAGAFEFRKALERDVAFSDGPRNAAKLNEEKMAANDSIWLNAYNEAVRDGADQTTAARRAGRAIGVKLRQSWRYAERNRVKKQKIS